jgi:hypothetical protein
MRNAGVRDLVQRVLEQHATNERMLDAYWQWATNPTPPSAGYALEENCGFIHTNLLTRYGEPAVGLVRQLAAECRDMRQGASVFDLQQAVVRVLNGPLGQHLREGIVRRLTGQSPTRRLLAAWLVTRSCWYARHGRKVMVAGVFDWSLGIDLQAGARDTRSTVARALYGQEVGRTDLVREAIAVGVLNRLLYRNLSGHMEPKLRPGPKIPAARMAY